MEQKATEYVDKCVIEHNKPFDKVDIFGFTLKINTKKDPRHEDYLPLLQKLSKKVDILDFTYEDKTKKGVATRLHIHGLFECPRNPYFKSVLPFGVHIKTERIYDLAGWRRYCNKNVTETLKKMDYIPINRIDNTEYLF